ncbi:hypothetical protein FOZ63_002089, partial [Perkinsus olseni]
LYNYKDDDHDYDHNNYKGDDHYYDQANYNSSTMAYIFDVGHSSEYSPGVSNANLPFAVFGFVRDVTFPAQPSPLQLVHTFFYSKVDSKTSLTTYPTTTTVTTTTNTTSTTTTTTTTTTTLIFQ